MQYRRFGRTGLDVSETGFGAWAIGGTSFGKVTRADSLAALARAEELGCNFVDTAAVYGASEDILGEFLRERRDRWIVATKYSGQPQGMTALVEEQLLRLRTDVIDYYQLHWAPPASGSALYDELEQLKLSGKVRFTGVSLYSGADIDYVLNHTAVDGLQVAFSLLDPRPFLPSLNQLRASGRAVIVRSAFKDGFLTGKYPATSVFEDPDDHRREWGAARIAQTAAAAERFRFLEDESVSMASGALSYALAFPEVSTVVLSTKNRGQAEVNFGPHARVELSAAMLERIADVQHDLGLLSDSWVGRLKGFVSRLATAGRPS